jgi:hypothetical protein
MDNARVQCWYKSVSLLSTSVKDQSIHTDSQLEATLLYTNSDTDMARMTDNTKNLLFTKKKLTKSKFIYDKPNYPLKSIVVGMSISIQNARSDFVFFYVIIILISN